MVKQYNTIVGMAVMRFSSMVAKFIYAVLGVVGDPRRRAALMHDLIKEADFVILLGHMWLQSWGSDNDTLIATLAKQTVTLTAQDLAVTQEYIKPTCLHVQKSVVSELRAPSWLDGYIGCLPAKKRPSRRQTSWVFVDSMSIVW
ncbi:hypothetical protein FS837_012433 [Tulasnella sp. UAMH 9824]|nr:hypothetical protein FS837_012433 [Tulasnella sp. UAMH 9824]